MELCHKYLCNRRFSCVLHYIVSVFLQYILYEIIYCGVYFLFFVIFCKSESHNFNFNIKNNVFFWPKIKDFSRFDVSSCFLLPVWRQEDDGPGDLDSHHHLGVPEVFRERRRQAQTEEERAEGSSSRWAARPDGSRQRPVRAGRPDGGPGRRRRLRVQLPGVHDVRLRGYHLLPRVFRARGRVRRGETDGELQIGEPSNAQTGAHGGENV